MEQFRANCWRLPNTTRRLPLYFPSVSSVKSGLAPDDYVNVLNQVVMGEQYLVSAFDLMRCSPDSQEGFVRGIRAAQSAGTVVLLDSGNYESFWKAPHQPWTAAEFHDALGLVRPMVAFGFDDQYPPSNYADHLRQLNAQYETDCRASAETAIIPIVHGDIEALVRQCPALARDQKLIAIAVPERSLGAGIFERARTVRALRAALDQTGQNVVLHLLGTGNPTSIALYTNEGADSFDGLEWCQTVVDHETGLLHHFSQGDFFRQQSRWGRSDISYIPRTLAHNLEFYRDWMSRLADALEVDGVKEFCRHNVTERVYVQWAAEFDWERT